RWTRSPGRRSRTSRRGMPVPPRPRCRPRPTSSPSPKACTRIPVPHTLALRRRVQFYETDAAGIVHFSTFFRYMEEAEHALWREAGLSIHPPDSDIGWPRVSASFDFQRALRFEDEFDVHLRIADLSQQAIRYECVVQQDNE